jgi:hypothetical protein
MKEFSKERVCQMPSSISFLGLLISMALDPVANFKILELASAPKVTTVSPL